MIAQSLRTSDSWMLVGIFALLFFLIFLSIAEMGLSRMTRPKANALAESGARGGEALVNLVTHPENWVNPLLLAVNVSQTVQATLTGVVAGHLFGAAGVAVGVVLNVVVFFVLAEAVPKTYAILNPERAALMTARPASFLVASAPLRLVSRSLIGLTNIIVKGKGLKQGPFVGEQEFLGIVEAAAHDEVIEHEERELIESVIEFGDTIVREIMKPRPDFVSVTNLTTIKNALDEAFEHGVSRLPVLIEDEDGNEDVLGLAFTKDLMQHERKGLAESLVSTVVRPATVIPENKPVSKLMREMQRDHFHLAIVADEYGSIVGLVTLEDCLEELVGDIIDEHDDEDLMVRSLSNGEFLVDGAMSISDFNEQFDLELPDEDWDTVGGFVFATLEHVPRIGESIDFDGWKFVAEEVEGRRIRRVRVSPVLEREENPRRDGVS